MSISPPPIEGDAVVITFDSFLNITGLNNSLSDVTITVAAINRAGQGDGRMFPVQLPKSLGKCCTHKRNRRYLYPLLNDRFLVIRMCHRGPNRELKNH